MTAAKTIGLLASVSLVLGGCIIVPPPSNEILSDGALQEPFAPDAVVALAVESVAEAKPRTENQDPLDPNLAAQQIHSRLVFELVEDELFDDVVAPGVAADYDMVVTITAFDDETMVNGTSVPSGSDGLNQMTAEVSVLKRDEGVPFRYQVNATAASETRYNPFYGQTGVQPMLNQAIDGIIDGLYQGLDQEAFLNEGIIAEVN